MTALFPERLAIDWDAIAQAAGAVDPSCVVPVDQCRDLWPHISFDDVPAVTFQNASSRY